MPVLARYRRLMAWGGTGLGRVVVATAIIVGACSSGDDAPDAISSDTAGSDESAEPARSTGSSIADDTTAHADDLTSDTPETTTTEDDDAEAPPTGTTLPMPPVTTTAPIVETDLVIDDETGLPVEADEEPLPPMTYDEVVDRGVEAGIWTEADGLARAIGHAMGLVPDDAVPGAATVVDPAITALLDRANELGASGTLTDAESENLQFFFEAAMPPEATRDRLVETAVGGVGGSSEPQGYAARGIRAPRAPANCAPVDPGNFSGSAWVEGCFRTDVYDVAGQTVRIISPDWFDADETLAGWPLFAFEVVRQSYDTYQSLGTIGALDILFAPTDTSSGTYGIAVSDEQWQRATVAGPCPIVIFPNSQATDLRFRQTLAHEIWHCVQHFSASMDNFSTNRWFLEGSAEYFSNVVYEDDDEEHVWNSSFDRRSRTQSLFQMDYHTWIWWQFLANRSSPRAVADLTWDMIAAGDGGKALMAERASEFQRFVVEFVAGTIRDQSGATLDKARRFNRPRVDVVKNDEGKTKTVKTEPMVATRYTIRYEKQLRFLQSDQTTATGGEHAMVEYDRRGELQQWKQIHPEVRSECKQPVWYVIVATSGADSYEAKVKVEETQQAVCDPCLLGTWSLQLDTFETMLMKGMEAEGGLPPGVSFDISGGAYFLMMDHEGTITEQRDGLEVTATYAGQSIRLTIDSFAEGDYQADGEKMSVEDVVESQVRVTSNFPGVGGAAGPSSIWTSSGDRTSGAGTYECDRDELTIEIEEFEPIVWDRVDRILEPPPTVPA
jgi:hypothetical protein